MFQFVQDSFNDAFKFAGVYSDDPDAVQLSATLTEGQFSTFKGDSNENSSLTSGWWDNGWWVFAVTLSNPANGRQVTTISRYDFTSAVRFRAACQNTSQALTPAVQRLINDVVRDPGFGPLIAR